MFKYLVVVVSFLMLVEIEGQTWHTSQVMLKKLYKLQKEHFTVINDYVDMETKRIEKLKSYVVSIQELINHNITKTSDYQYNHINTIRLITRIHNIMNEIEIFMDNEQSIETALSKIDEQNEISDMQLLYAHRGFRRLQRFYQIPACDMATGRHGNQIIGDQLNTRECYIITENCFREFDMYGATDWGFLTYYKWLNEGLPMYNIDVNNLKHILITSSVYTGVNFTSIIDPNNLLRSESAANFAHYYFFMTNDILPARSNRKTMDIFYAYRQMEFAYSQTKFNDLCMHGKSNHTLSKELKCRFQTKNSSYRILMPFKEEDVHNKDPLIKIYHDVLRDNEIKKLKIIAETSMKDALIKSPKGESIFVELTRSNQVGWIGNYEMEKRKLHALDKRIADFTGLYTQSAEDYQIANYGLGGYYNTHFDAFNRKIVIPHFGNRFSTVLFYLNDVQNGGYTAFPNLDIVSPAEKGAALMWYNLNPSNGSIYAGSLHGACPLLTGNKWILTKWFLEEGQNIITYKWRDLKE